MKPQTGFRIDASKLRRKIVRALEEIRADRFKPELADFTRKSLATASRITPVRDYGLIKRNQRREYNKRINCIPTSHRVVDPSLRVRSGNKHWLFFHGKWMLANRGRKLSDAAWSAYQDLLTERQRRMRTPFAAFLAGRAQARFLYRKTWSQVAISLSLSIPVGGAVATSRSRHNPPKTPPRGYGQWRGGKRVLSVVIYNPLLEQQSAYKPFTGRAIINTAMQRHEPQFKRRFRSRLNRMLYAIFHTK